MGFWTSANIHSKFLLLIVKYKLMLRKHLHDKREKKFCYNDITTAVDFAHFACRYYVTLCFAGHAEA